MESWCLLCDWHMGPPQAREDVMFCLFFLIFKTYKNDFTITEVLSYKPRASAEERPSPDTRPAPHLPSCTLLDSLSQQSLPELLRWPWPEA